MKENNPKEQKIDQVLESIEGIKRATASPYFFTRLQQKLMPSDNSILGKIGSLISRPSIAFATLIIMILLNIAILIKKPSNVERFDDTGDMYTASTTTIDYENP